MLYQPLLAARSLALISSCAAKSAATMGPSSLAPLATVPFNAFEFATFLVDVVALVVPGPLSPNVLTVSS
eukprot:2305205-Pyramimonas_sp.AAC.1